MKEDIGGLFDYNSDIDLHVWYMWNSITNKMRLHIKHEVDITILKIISNQVADQVRLDTYDISEIQQN